MALQSGTVLAPINGSASIPVNFSGSFPGVPAVILTPNLAGGAVNEIFSVQAGFINSAGFQVFVTGGSPGTPIEIGWIAFVFTAPAPSFNGITGSIEYPALPLQTIIPSYLYQQYADDQNLQAFVDAYNTLSQQYLNWFNSTPLAVYTSPNVVGPLLDWIGNGIYGIQRPVFSTIMTQYETTAVSTFPLLTLPISGSSHTSSGSATVASDDFYKRTLTWLTYIGNGPYFNIPMLRLRIARFLYGTNGTDVSLAQAQNVSIAVETSPSISLAITIPPSQAATFFQQAFNSGILSFPFQIAATVTIS